MGEWEYRMVGAYGYYMIYKCERTTLGITGNVVVRVNTRTAAIEVTNALNAAYQEGLVEGSKKKVD